MAFLREYKVPFNAKIIDVGGGDSLFVDNLLKLGYGDISVLDISEKSLERAKSRLGSLALNVKWVVADAAYFFPTEKYDFWHDRAAFHFLTDEQEITNYLNALQNNVNENGISIIGTFSERGPLMCSGIEVKQYSEKTMSDRLAIFFEKIKCISIDHSTPFHTIQNFLFCSFRKRVTAN